jgi:hypothetical protein
VILSLIIYSGLLMLAFCRVLLRQIQKPQIFFFTDRI